MLVLEFTSFSFVWLSLMLGLGLSILPLCFEVTPPENTHKHSWNKQTNKKGFITDQWLHGKLAQIMQAPILTVLCILYTKTRSSWHTLVSKNS